jgi:Na+-driven multidrug efflux pump
MFLVWFNAEALLLFLKQDPEVAQLAAIYLRWVSLGLPGKASNFPFPITFKIIMTSPLNNATVPPP